MNQNFVPFHHRPEQTETSISKMAKRIADFPIIRNIVTKVNQGLMDAEYNQRYPVNPKPPTQLK